MELLVISALALVGFCGYLTVREIGGDLQREGALHSLAAWWRDRKRNMYRDRLYPGRLMQAPVPVRVRPPAEEERTYRPHHYHD